MDVILKNNTLIRVVKSEKEEEKGLVCSEKCPFFKRHEWEDGPMEKTLLSYSCILTGEDKQFPWNIASGRFCCVRTEECAKLDRNTEVIERRNHYIGQRSHNFGEYPMPSSYTQVS